MYVLQVCRARFHQTIVMVTHDRETASCADQVWWMEDGQIQPKDIKEEWEKAGHVGYEMQKILAKQKWHFSLARDDVACG